MGRDERNNQNPLRGLPGGMAGIPIIGSTAREIPSEVWDALGRPLQVGDRVILQAATNPIFLVVSIQPVQDSKAPQGLMEVDVNARMRFYATRVQPTPEFVRVVSKQEADAATPPSSNPPPVPGGAEPTDAEPAS